MPRPHGPCQLAGCGEAGLTSRGLTVLLPLASCRRAPTRTDHQAALCPSLLGRIDVIGREQHPGHPRVFVRERDHGSVGASSCDQGTDPLTSAILLQRGPAERRPGSVHEACTAIASPACADPQQRRLASRRMLAWHAPEPCGTLPAIRDVWRILDRGHQSRGREGAKAWDGQETWADRMGLANGFERFVVIGQPLLQGEPLRREWLDDRSTACGPLPLCLLE